MFIFHRQINLIAREQTSWALLVHRVDLNAEAAYEVDEPVWYIDMAQRGGQLLLPHASGIVIHGAYFVVLVGAEGWYW